MGKNSKDSKASSKLAKKERQAEKSAKAEAKLIGKGKGKEEDLEAILAKFQDDWKKSHAVTEEVQSAPSRRSNATLCALGDYLWLIGGEYYDGQKAFFYNDTFRYSPEKNEWRLYTSPTAPSPRSAHCVTTVAKDGGQIFLFGGEYSSSNQSNFLHFKDLWCFGLKDCKWVKVDTPGKNTPSARSGARMVAWKQYLILFGGFQDTGVKTTYLSDLWLFDTDTYKWKQIETKDVKGGPVARSGFSMIPCAEGAIVYGGYRKEYKGGKTFIGIALEDMWTLKMDADLTKIAWEKRRKGGVIPSARSGCSMTNWAAKNIGVLFGGVRDEEDKDDNLKSVFYNELYCFNPASNKWSIVTLQRKKKKTGGGGAKAKRKAREAKALQEAQVGDGDVDMDAQPSANPSSDEDSETDEEKADVTKDTGMEVDGSSSVQEALLEPPLARYNAMTAVLRNSLYIYGGTWESARREFTLDDFHVVNLDKKDGYVALKATDIESEAWQGSDDEDDMDVEGEEEDGEEDSDDDSDDESG